MGILRPGPRLTAGVDETGSGYSPIPVNRAIRGHESQT